MSAHAMRRHLQALQDQLDRQRVCACAHERREHIYAAGECRVCDCGVWTPEAELQRVRCACSHDAVQHDEVGCCVFVCGCRQLRPVGGVA